MHYAEFKTTGNSELSELNVFKTTGDKGKNTKSEWEKSFWILNGLPTRNSNSGLFLELRLSDLKFTDLVILQVVLNTPLLRHSCMEWHPLKQKMSHSLAQIGNFLSQTLKWNNIKINGFFLFKKTTTSKVALKTNLNWISN